MRKLFHLTLVLLLVISFSNCAKDIDPEITFPDNATSVSVNLDCFSTSTATFSFSSATNWTLEKNDSIWWVNVSPSSGKGGNVTVTLSANHNLDFTNSERSTILTLTSGDITRQVTVTQMPAFKMGSTYFNVGVNDSLLTLSFKTFAQKSEIKAYSDSLIGKAIIKGIGKLEQTSEHQWTMTLKLNRNLTHASRTGYMQLEYNGLRSSIISITQQAGATGESTDYSADGQTTLMQSHTLGDGIPLVIMGDGFLDKDIADGTYDKAMNEAMNYFFNIEPTKSFREYFDVYSVKAVSRYNSFALSTDTTSTATAFGCTFGGGTLITGKDGKCQNYAKKANSQIDLDNTLIIVVLNSPDYAGTCSMYYNEVKTDIPTGVSIAYVPMTDSEIYGGVGFEQVLHHEAIGHGLGKLDDEYYYQSQGTITEAAKSKLQLYQSYGICRNVDIHADVTQTFWKTFSADNRYAKENIGTYEGASTYTKGVYRATETSIMLDNTGVFNAPSREAIYKRIFFIANKGNYVYDYDKFTNYDAVNRTTISRSFHNILSPQNLKPLGRPQIIPVKRR